MKDIQQEQDIYELIGDKEESIECGFKGADPKFIFDVLSGQYSDKIGSIVREYTSNCFDAQSEINVKEPVVVKLDKDEGGTYISFSDSGIGISPTRMKDVFSQWFCSTKRQSEKQIGSYGLGGKTALSYTNSFFIITKFDGIEYEYLHYKTDTVPGIDLLKRKLIQDNSTGTTIKIYINQTDIDKFDTAVKKQLLLFNDVIYFNFGKFDDWNNRKIYEFKTFYHCDYDFREGFDSIELALGPVIYPIDFTLLYGKYARDFKSQNVFLKFDISELKATPTRESIEYRDIEIKRIKDRLDEHKEEIDLLYKSQDFEIKYDYLKYHKLSANWYPNLQIGNNIVSFKDYELDKLDYTYNVFNKLKVDAGRFSFVIKKRGQKGRRAFQSLSYYKGEYHKLKDMVFIKSDTLLKPRILNYIKERYDVVQLQCGMATIKGLGEEHFQKGKNLIIKTLEEDFSKNCILAEDVEIPSHILFPPKVHRKKSTPTGYIEVDNAPMKLLSNFTYVYGFKREHDLPDWMKYLYSINKILSIEIHKKDYKMIKDNEKVIHWRQFIENHKAISNIKTAIMIENSLFFDLKGGQREQIIRAYGKGYNTFLNSHINIVYKFHEKYFKALKSMSILEKEAILGSDMYYNPCIYDSFLKVEKFFAKAELLLDIMPNENNIKFIVQYLKQVGKRIDLIHYFQPTQQELKFAEEAKAVSQLNEKLTQWDS